MIEAVLLWNILGGTLMVYSKAEELKIQLIRWIYCCPLGMEDDMIRFCFKDSFGVDLEIFQ